MYQISAKQVDISLYLNQLLIKCQILAVFDVQYTGARGTPSTDDVKRVLSCLNVSKCSTLCYTEKTGAERKGQRTLPSVSLKHVQTWTQQDGFFFFYYCIYPRVIAVSSFTFKASSVPELNGSLVVTELQAGEGAKNHLLLTCFSGRAVCYGEGRNFSPGSCQKNSFMCLMTTQFCSICIIKAWKHETPASNYLQWG